MDRQPLPPIWVLNLRRSPERRALITEHLDSLGLDHELIAAVDGRALSPSDLAASYDASRAIAQIGRELTRAEVGCCLSHLGLYRRQVEQGLDEVVILEDDAVVAPEFLEIMRRRDALPPDWELVSFFRGDTLVSYWGRRALDGRHRCVKFASIAWGAVGYLLRQSGARKLLTHGLPVHMEADRLIGGGVPTGVRLYGLDPPCIRERAAGREHSTMPENYALRPQWPKKGDFPLHHWLMHRSRVGLIHFYQKCNPFCIV